MQTAKFVEGYWTQMKNATMNSVIEVECPHCKAVREIEADGYYDDVECEVCGKHYRTIGVV